VKVDSSSVINIEKFVEDGSIDPLYYDSSYFMGPDGNAGQDVYAVLYEAIEKTGRVALSSRHDRRQAQGRRDRETRSR
jgi:DNA end-binding protein Ku